MPVLDCEVWVGLHEREWGIPGQFLKDTPIFQGEVRKVILYNFYKKPVNRKVTLLERTALPEGI